ncbi:hypothetical protein [Streptomyces toxytricini]|uniref:hypothetical protein n=1 Tax=Streptomyces toxytricini TaxID=67369 RepID=UPI0034311281
MHRDGGDVHPADRGGHAALRRLPAALDPARHGQRDDLHHGAPLRGRCALLPFRVRARITGGGTPGNTRPGHTGRLVG